MIKDKYLKKANHTKTIRTVLSVLLSMVFVPLLVTNGFLIARGALNQDKLPDSIDLSTMAVQPNPSADKPIFGKSNENASTAEDTASIIEEPATQQAAAISSQEATQNTQENQSDTNARVESQTEPVTAGKPPATQPNTTRPVTTQPAATQPAATQPATTQPATPSNAPCIHLDTDEQTMLNLINQERKNNGLPELKLDTRLRTVAQTKCKEMIQLNYFAHQSPVYGSPFDMMAYFGIRYAKAGENLAMNTNVERAHNDLMNSDAHRKAILSPDYTHVGIGAYQGVSGKYYSQMFACY